MCVCGLVVVPLLSVTLSRMPLQLYDLPFDMLEMIGEFYDATRGRVSPPGRPKTPPADEV